MVSQDDTVPPLLFRSITIGQTRQTPQEKTAALAATRNGYHANESDA